MEKEFKTLSEKIEALFDAFETKIRVYGIADVDIMQDELQGLLTKLGDNIKEFIKVLKKKFCCSKKSNKKKKEHNNSL